MDHGRSTASPVGISASPLAAESKPVGDAAPTPVYSASTVVPSILASPLSVQVTVLHKPEFYEMSTSELVEEGDILYDVLANPLVHPECAILRDESPTELRLRSDSAALAMPGVSTALSLPSDVSQLFVGEPFRAFLCFHNAAAYPLSNLTYTVSCAHPTRRPLILTECTSPRLGPKSNASFKVEFKLVECGRHTLHVNASFTDSINEVKRLIWSSNFNVDRIITETHCKICIVPVMTRPLTSNVGGNDSNSVYGVQFSANGPTIQDVISNITLPTRELFELLAPPKRLSPSPSSSAASSKRPWWPAYAEDLPPPELSLRAPPTNSSSADLLEDVHMQPGEARQYSFELVLRPDHLRALPTCHGAAGAASAVAARHFREMGHVEWHWRRAHCDGGSSCGRPIRLSRLTKQQPIELFVTGARPAAPLVGQPVALECVALNYSESERVDVALRVRPEQLLAEMLVYAGPLLCPLGFIEPRGTLSFGVSVVAWRQGWAAVRGGLELCDARAPETLLWPIRPLTTKPPPLSSTNAPEMTEVPQETYPPVLCEMLVC